MYVQYAHFNYWWAVDGIAGSWKSSPDINGSAHVVFIQTHDIQQETYIRALIDVISV